ncbi:MAG: PAS domain S-box protein [Paludibacter sp.]|nr:PAS domain S-box protein [Paludibacter sp.]
MESRLIKILAIDDNPDNLITIQALVNEVYPKVVVFKALSGRQGISIATRENPDVILLDIVMPDMDGFEVCTRLKADKNLCDIPVIFVTAIKGDKASRIKALECGAEAFLAKPIDESELIAQIRAMVKIKNASIERQDENKRLAALVQEQTNELKKTYSATLNLLEDLKNENAARKKTEESLRESEEKFRDMANLLPQIVFEIDLKGTITYVNKQAYSIFGYKEDDLIGLNSLIFHDPEERSLVMENIKLKVSGQDIERKEYNMVRNDGSIFPALIYTSLVTNSNKTVGLRGIVIDITEQKLTEEKITHSARLYALLSQINQAIVRTQSVEELYQTICEVAIEYGQFHMAWVGLNDEFEKRIKPVNWAGHNDGYLDKIIIQSGFEVFGSGPTGSAFREGKIYYSNNIATDPMMRPWKDEALIRGYKSLIAVPFQQKGRILGTLTLYAKEADFFSDDELRLLKEIGDDISFAINAIDTEILRNKTEKALEQSRNELKTIYDHAPVMMCVVDKDRRILYANQSFTALTGILEEEMIGGAVGNVIGCISSLDDPHGCGLGLNCWNCSLRVAMEQTFDTGEGTRNVEYQSTLNIGGERHDISLLGSTAIISNDDTDSLLLCLHDITDRKLAEDALQKSEMLLRTFIDNSPFDIWARDIDNVGILENKKFVDHYGSIIGHTPNVNTKIDKETMLHWLNINERVLAGDIIDEEYEFEINNEIRLFQQTVFPITNNHKIIGLAGFNIDITERKQAEEALFRNNSRLELAMQVGNMAWWEMDIETGNVLFGKRKTDMLGYKAEDFVHFKDFMDIVHPDDHDITMNALREHLYGHADKYETEYRILTSKGDYKWFYELGNISIKDSTGNPLTMSGLVLDVTARKNTEKELYDQKQFFEQMFMQSSLSTQILDREGWCERVNPKLSEIFGVEAKDMEGKVYNIFDDKEIIQKGILKKLKNVFNNGNTAEWDVFFDIGEAADSQNITVKEKKKVWYNNWAYPIFGQNGEISHVIIQHNDITDRKIAEEALGESQEQLKKFAAHLQNVREEERVLLAREIHDELGQILIAIKIDMGMLKQNVLKGIDLKHSEQVLLKFDGLFTLVDNTIKTARKIMTDLRPEVLDLLGFVDTIKQHLNGFQERHKIKCIFNNTITNLELDSQQSVALFRIIQEALNNVAKHSKATELRVILDLKDEKLTLEVVDNGIGFDENHKKNSDSYGLIGMRERVFLLDGELIILGQKNIGTSIKVVMPYITGK